MIPAPFKVVLDACVLYPFTVRDVLLSAAHAGFYQVYWSETILEEAIHNLVADRRMTEDQAAKLMAAMRRAFPEAQVTDYEPLVDSMRNETKDRHVVAAAVKAGAQVIVTSNLRHFYDLPSGVEAQSPAEFLCNLFDLDPDRMIDVLRAIVSRLRSPPMALEELADATGLSAFATLVREHLADDVDGPDVTSDADDSHE